MWRPKRLIDCTTGGYRNMPRTDVANLYLDNIRKYPVLSEQEEAELLHTAKNGVTAEERLSARNRIVECNQRFVISVAKRLCGGEENVMDAVSEGNIGLMEAIDGYDGTTHHRFITYAVYWVKKRILEYRNGCEKLIPLKGKQRAVAYGRKISEDFLHKNGRYPTNTELCDMVSEVERYSNVTPEDFNTITLTSIDIRETDNMQGCNVAVPTKVMTDIRLLSGNNADEFARKYDDSVVCSDYLSRLRYREQEIVRKYYGIGCQPESLDTIGNRFGLTGTRVSQILKKSLRTMQQFSGVE